MSEFTINLWLAVLCLMGVALAITIVVGGLMVLRIGIHDFLAWYAREKRGKKNLESVERELRETQFDLLQERRQNEQTRALLDAAMSRMIDNGIAPPKQEESSVMRIGRIN